MAERPVEVIKKLEEAASEMIFVEHCSKEKKSEPSSATNSEVMEELRREERLLEKLIRERIQVYSSSSSSSSYSIMSSLTCIRCSGFRARLLIVMRGGKS